MGYKGILDGIDFKTIGLEFSLKRVIENTREVLEVGIGKDIGRIVHVLMHLSLLDLNERFFCLTYSSSSHLGLFGDGIKYLDKMYHLYNRKRGLLWGVIEDSKPLWLSYDKDLDMYCVDDLSSPEVQSRTINLVSAENFNLMSVHFCEIKYQQEVIGILAADIYSEGEKIEIPKGIPFYMEFLESFRSTMGIVIEGLHRSYYDFKLNKDRTKRIFGPGYLLPLIEKYREANHG